MNVQDVISHYGITGQKWGLRRFQNEDGTLTSLGKRRVQQKKGRSTNIIEVDRLNRERDNKRNSEYAEKRTQAAIKQDNALKRQQEEANRKAAEYAEKRTQAAIRQSEAKKMSSILKTDRTRGKEKVKELMEKRKMR